MLTDSNGEGILFFCNWSFSSGVKGNCKCSSLIPYSKQKICTCLEEIFTTNWFQTGATCNRYRVNIKEYIVNEVKKTCLQLLCNKKNDKTYIKKQFTGYNWQTIKVGIVLEWLYLIYDYKNQEFGVDFQTTTENGETCRTGKRKKEGIKGKKK
jgi:hypothetical protein